MVEYKLKANKNNSTTQYGIEILDDNIGQNYIDGISESCTAVTQLVEMCNELQIEPCQFEYVLDDFLTDFKI